MTTKRVLFSLSLIFLFLNSSFSQNADCIDPLILCNKETITISTLDGAGNKKDDLGDLGCSDDLLKEQNSIWIKWIVEKSGDLGFTVTPKREQDDLDFVVYKLDEITDCNSLQSIRCMASGQNLGQPNSARCKGATGLKQRSSDHNEYKGCYGEDDNFLSSLQVFKGETYLLYVNNYSSTDGFDLQFSGDSEFVKTGCEKAVIKELFISQVFPNPTKQTINLIIKSPKIESTNISIIDPLGKKYISSKHDLEKGEQQISVKVKDLAAGTYFVQLRIGETTFQRKFTKI